MIDKDKIPEPLYRELIEMFGYEKAEELIDQEHYSFRMIQNRLILEKLKRRFGKKFLIYLLIIFLIAAITYSILKWKIII